MKWLFVNVSVNVLNLCRHSTQDDLYLSDCKLSCVVETVECLSPCFTECLWRRMPHCCRITSMLCGLEWLPVYRGIYEFVREVSCWQVIFFKIGYFALVMLILLFSWPSRAVGWLVQPNRRAGTSVVEMWVYCNKDGDELHTDKLLCISLDRSIKNEFLDIVQNSKWEPVAIASTLRARLYGRQGTNIPGPSTNGRYLLPHQYHHHHHQRHAVHMVSKTYWLNEMLHMRPITSGAYPFVGRIWLPLCPDPQTRHHDIQPLTTSHRDIWLTSMLTSLNTQ